MDVVDSYVCIQKPLTVAHKAENTGLNITTLLKFSSTVADIGLAGSVSL